MVSRNVLASDLGIIAKGGNNKTMLFAVTDLKTTEPLSESLGEQQAVLAYMSDILLIDVCLIAHARSFDGNDFQVASLDHALWYHEDFRADEWLLHTVQAERIGGGRGLARGSFYTTDGRLVATAVQQGVMRFR